MCFAWAGNQDDHKHPKLAEEDLSTFSENTSAREGKNLFLRMCTLHAVITGSLSSIVRQRDSCFRQSAQIFSGISVENDN